jgi:hypothetical protein
MMSYDNFTPIAATFTPDTGAYGSGDVVGSLLSVTFPNGVPFILGGITVSVGEASKALAGTIYLYDSAPTTIADNAAWATGLTAADNAKQIASILLPTALSSNSRNIYEIKYGGGSTMPLIGIQVGTLYFYYVTTSTPTFSAAQTVTIRFFPLYGV